jgi:hypothetical protein
LHAESERADDASRLHRHRIWQRGDSQPLQLAAKSILLASHQGMLEQAIVDNLVALKERTAVPTRTPDVSATDAARH